MTRKKANIMYESIDGATFSASSAKEIVLQMSRRDYLANGKKQYMKAVAKRLEIFGKEIEFSTHEEFLKALEDAQIIRKLIEH